MLGEVEVLPVVLEQKASAAPIRTGSEGSQGQVRWYLVACPQGHESSTCAKVRQIVPQSLLADAFVPRVEHVSKRQGVWQTQVRNLFSGYFVAVTRDAAALDKALCGLSFAARLAGAMDGGFAPMAADVQQFLAASMDERHVIRRSEGEIVSDKLHIYAWPLAGQETRVATYNRRKCSARVRVCEGDEGFTLTLPLAIPVRR